MDPGQFAGKHLHPYKMRGSEVIPVLCPYCRGGKHGKDKGTFAMNINEGTFNCMRGGCMVSGSFEKLKKDFGESNMEFHSPKPKEYKTPKTKLKPITSEIEKYLTLRGFSKATWERRGVGESEGKIVFPYYENGQAVLMKFREPKKKGKWIREPGGKPVFWGMDLVDQGQNILLICEGEFDAIALDECGMQNVVSIPSGANDLTCVEHCWDWLQRFTEIIIWPDNDEPGKEMSRNLVRKLGEYRCSIVHSDRKDANECLAKDGKQAVKDAVFNAKEVPVAGIIRLADVKNFDPRAVERVSSSIKGIDRVVGGYMMGMVSVWTGINSSGKSTFLGQELIEAINQDFNVCAYSGELPAPMFRYWIDLQVAGPRHLDSYFDEFKGDFTFFVNPDKLEKIRQWYYHRFFLHDVSGATTEDDILRVFQYAAMRYNCKVFMVDNLMTTILTSRDSDFYRKQSAFVGKLHDFARGYDCHVHIVAHPRKSGGRLTKMDVAGSGEITNRADNVFAVHRIKEDERSNLPDIHRDCHNIVDIFKNRFSGRQDVSIGLKFEESSKRFYMPAESDTLNKKYKWEEASE